MCTLRENNLKLIIYIYIYIENRVCTLRENNLKLIYIYIYIYNFQNWNKCITCGCVGMDMWRVICKENILRNNNANVIMPSFCSELF